MPLRDHFRPPLDDVHSWDELHGMWPAMIVRQLIEVLPEPYFAAPGVHLGTLYEVDVGTYREPPPDVIGNDTGEGGVALATYAASEADTDTGTAIAGSGRVRSPDLRQSAQSAPGGRH